MFCSECGKQVADSTKFCESCGAVQSNVEQTPKINVEQVVSKATVTSNAETSSGNSNVMAYVMGAIFVFAAGYFAVSHFASNKTETTEIAQSNQVESSGNVSEPEKKSLDNTKYGKINSEPESVNNNYRITIMGRLNESGGFDLPRIKRLEINNESLIEVDKFKLYGPSSAIKVLKVGELVKISGIPKLGKQSSWGLNDIQVESRDSEKNIEEENAARLAQQQERIANEQKVAMERNMADVLVVALCTHPGAAETLARNLTDYAANNSYAYGVAMTSKTYSEFCTRGGNMRVNVENAQQISYGGWGENVYWIKANGDTAIGFMARSCNSHVCTDAEIAMLR